MGFSDLCTGVHTLLWSPPLGYGLDMGTHFLGKECSKSDGMSLLKLTKDHTFGLLILLLSSLSLVLIKQAVLSYPMERPLWKGQELKVFSTQQPVKNWPIAHSPQETESSHPLGQWDWEVDSFTVEPWDDHSLSQPLDYSVGGTWAVPRFLIRRNYNMINVVFLSP